MKVVVTGASGLVGTRLCHRLQERQHYVVGWSLAHSAAGETVRKVDLTDAEAVVDALSADRPDVVIHAAAATDVDGCEREPQMAYALNCDASATLAVETKRIGAHLIQVSTDYVFDGTQGSYSEEQVPNPKGVYATTKYMGECAVRSLGGDWSIARVAVVYGWPPAARMNFGAWLVRALQSGDAVNLFTDQRVSPTCAMSAADMLTELAERRLTGIWHTAGAAAVSRYEFGLAVARQFAFPTERIVPTLLAQNDSDSIRPLNSSLDVSKASRELHQKPLSLDESLSRFFVEWKGRAS